MYTASVAFFEALWEAGVSHCFVNLGSDHPSLLEAMVQGQRTTPDRFPKIITCPNEMVALSAAHGMFLTTARAQAVIVHVDVGTAALGAAVHNASVGRVPVLIFAGLSPATQAGEARGSRSEFIHWLQDVPDQRALVAQYCRYSSEIRSARNVKQMVARALSFATSDPRGPAYLMATREVLEEELPPAKPLDMRVWGPIAPAALPDAGAVDIARLLRAAREPLCVVGYAGRRPAAVAALVELAERVPGLRVFDAIGSDVSFPAAHRAFLGVRYGIHARIESADAILVLDCDVPWIPTQCRPREDASIVHVDVDPLKAMMPLFYIPAKARYRADAATALAQVNKCLASMDGPREAEAKVQALEQEHRQWMEELGHAAEPRADGKLTCAHLVGAVRDALPEDSTVLVEAVTETATVLGQLQPTKPGSMFNCGGGGLGWFGGAAVGAKLGLTHTSTPRFVAAIVGDGTFLFSVPSSVYWMSHRYAAPFLTIILNNKGWNAPRKSANIVHPTGLNAGASNRELNISLDPTPDFAGIAAAAANGAIWGRKVASVEELRSALPEAVKAVMEGRSAVIDAVIVGGPVQMLEKSNL